MVLSCGVSAIVGYCAWNSHAIDQQWREREAQAQRLKAEIDNRFETGSPQSAVLDFLGDRAGHRFTDGQSVYWVAVGTAPSRDWRLICGLWYVGVEVTFKESRLVGTEATARGDCL